MCSLRTNYVPGLREKLQMYHLSESSKHSIQEIEMQGVSARYIAASLAAGLGPGDSSDRCTRAEVTCVTSR